MTDRTKVWAHLLDRVFDELGLIILAAIAVLIILLDPAMTDKIVSGIVTGILGYMKGRADGHRVERGARPPPATADKPPAEG